MKAKWIKSSRSDSVGQNCVELAALGNVVGLRDSKNPEGAPLTMAPQAFATLLEALKGR